MKLLYSKLLSKHLIRYVEIHVRSFRLSPNTTVDMAESRHHEPVVKLQQQLYHYDHEIETMSMDTHNVVPVWQDHVVSACNSLKNNKIIAVPTDTIYGVAGLAQSTTAVNQIYNIKHRHPDKPVAICVGDISDVKKWGKVKIPHGLLTELLPGPVTIVLERTAALNPLLNPGTSLVGIRVPNHGFVRDITRACGEPLALTSANLSTGPSAVTVQEFSELWPQLDIVFDGGTLGATPHSRQGSTVVDLSKPDHYTIIRQGSAYNQTIESLKKYNLDEDPKS